jgi:carbon monoxide dehydrogenase subunit G
MIIEDKFVISAPIRQVWDYFLDIPGLSGCVPGADRVEQVDDSSFTGNLVVKVGPIKTNFSGKATLTELEPPHRLTARAQGKDKNTASMVSATFTAALTEVEPDQTEVAYKVDVVIRGRLAQFGQGVIRETSKQITRVFVACAQAKIVAQIAATEQPGVEPEADPNRIAASTASGTPPQVQSSTPPSLLSILFKSVIASINNWFKALWSSSGKPVD